MSADEAQSVDVRKSRATRAAIYAALRKLALPLVDIFLRFGITRRDFQSVIDQVYVEAARRGARASDRGIVSQIALRTGLDRKKITQLLAGLDSSAETPLEHTNDAKSVILAKWHSEAAYTDGEGNPLPLPKYGPGPSIRDLVDDYGGEIKTGPLVDQLVGYGILEEEDGKFIPKKRAFEPGNATDAQIAIFATSTTDFLNTMLHNLHIWRGEGEGRFQNESVVRIPESQLAESEAFCRQRLLDALLEIDDYLTIKQSSLATGERTVRFGANANLFVGEGSDSID